MILAGDIGGTKTNLAYYSVEEDCLVPSLMKSYQSHEFGSLNEVVRKLMREHPAKITGAAFGIAGPIVDGRSKLTNLGWDVDGREIAAELKLQGVGLLNDLEATAYGTLRLTEGEKTTLQKGVAQPHRAIAVIAAGTGLGEGGLVWDGVHYRAIPSEGGHTDFAPRNDLEIELLQFLLTKFRRASYERIVAGPGMLNLYEFFRRRSSSPEPAWLTEKMKTGDPAAAISGAGLEGSDQVCLQVLNMFVSLYGAEAGNLALKLLATGGVFVGGGIAPKILTKLQEGAFVDSFVHKGRYQSLLENIPIHVVLNDRTALIGAAHYAVVMNAES